MEKAHRAGIMVREYYARPDPAIAGEAEKRGLEYVPVVWVPEAGSASEGVVDVYGGRRLFAFNNSGCISNPSIRKRVLARVEEAATRLEAEAVILDALRFPSPHDKAVMFSCFCPHCRRTMVEQGVDPERLRSGLARAAGTLYKYPHLRREALAAFHAWIWVRQHIVGETLGLVREKAREYGLRLWAAVFPPSLAWLVGQNYEDLRGQLDEVHVMLYHKCSGAACLNHELQSLAGLIGGGNARTALRILAGIDVEDPSTLDSNGLSVEAIVEEAKRAVGILGEKTVPILQLDSQGLEAAGRLRGTAKIAYLA